MKILVAMSGGVDSTVAAKMLIDEGHEVAGAYMKMLPDDFELASDSSDARKAAEKLGIPFYEFDVSDEFHKNVLEYFCESYIKGSTPNPCIICNQTMKFGIFIDKATELGFDYIATGHYAKIVRDGNDVFLMRSADLKKDQSYFLHGLKKEQLKRAIFPLEGADKEYVRKIAEECGFDNAAKKDSQDICFVKTAPGAYVEFIEKFIGQSMKSGLFKDVNGNILGTHEGIARYTIGQRKGVKTAFGKPLYVVSKSAEDQTVVMGENEMLFSDTVKVSNFNLIFKDFDENNITAKHRYGQKDVPARLEIDGNMAIVKFDTPQRAVTPGQFLVVYDGDIVVGGGEIQL